MAKKSKKQENEKLKTKNEKKGKKIEPIKKIQKQKKNEIKLKIKSKDKDIAKAKEPKNRFKKQSKQKLEKIPKESETNTEQTKPSQSGYIFFKNPKYFKLAEKILNSTPEQIQKEISELNYSIPEKIHVGNLLSGLAANYCQQGVLSDNYCYNDLNLNQYLTTYKDLFENSTAKKLQELLILNEQPKTATKNILCERVADQTVLGRIPKCPSCLGGRFFFNIIPIIPNNHLPPTN